MLLRRACALGAFLLGTALSMSCTKLLGLDQSYVETGGGGPTSTHAQSSGASSSGGASSGTGGSDGGVPLPCSAPSDCPGKESECQTRACNGGFCGVTFTAAGTAITAQKAGDCHKIVCDGHGALDDTVDDTDVPNDSNPCTKDVCTGGVPSNPPDAANMPCGNGLACDTTGHCSGCTSVGQCPGTDTECQKRSCTSGQCGFLYTASGTPVAMQTPGDCTSNVCNGAGAVSIVSDPADIHDDGNPCTIDACSNGSPTHTNAASGAPCVQGKNTVCDGAGSCVECLVASACPGGDDECKTRTCAGGTCGENHAPAGAPVSLQTPNDCKKNVCNGAGGVTQSNDDSDVMDDGNPCTTDSCSGGAPVHTPVAMGTSCGPMKACNAGGGCVGCMTGADCPGADTECQTRTCASGVCGLSYAPLNTPVAAQTPGDCKKNVCNGAGSTSVAADDADVPVDGDPCTSDVCSSGTPSNPAAPAGTACTGGGTVCNGAGGCGVCVPGDSKACCHGHTTACCTAAAFPTCDPEKQSCAGSSHIGVKIQPNILCCCDGAQDCDSTGHWGACL